MNQGFQSGWRLRSPIIVAPKLERTLTAETPGDPERRNPQKLDAEKTIIELFPKEGEQFGLDWLPFYPLKIAAGGFLAGDAPEPEGWVNAAKHGFSKRLTKGMFVTQVVGESMMPTINNGAYCVFRSPVEGSRQGRVVLVQKRNMADPETGGSYTVKRYRSTKSTGEDTWQHESIDLVPDNPDHERFPILRFSPIDETDLQVIAEFIQMLSPADF